MTPVDRCREEQRRCAEHLLANGRDRGAALGLADWMAEEILIMSAIKREVVIGDCHLLLGNCREILTEVQQVDVVISDPPYGNLDTHARHLSGITLRNGEPARQALGFDGLSKQEMMSMATQWANIAKRWVVFTCEWRYVAAIDETGVLVRFGIWRKPDGAPQFTGDRPGTGWEAVAICHRAGKKRWNGGGSHAFWQYPKGQNDSGHPTGKPLGLFVSFVEQFSDPGELILDPFMGSGTTGVACVRLGRKFTGIEIDEKYFEIACRRIEAEYAQPKLFRQQEPRPEQVDMFET